MMNAKLSSEMKNLNKLPEGSTIELIGENLILTKKQRGEDYRWVNGNHYLPSTYIAERGYRLIDQQAREQFINDRMNFYSKKGILNIENVLTLLTKTKEEANTMFYID